MDFLNNLNVIISIIAGLVTIGTALGSVKFLQRKATSSEQRQVVRLSSSLKQTSYQIVPKSLSKLDWMEVLWKGFEDILRSREGMGWLYALIILFVGLFITFNIALYIGIIFVGFYICFIILFYVYFVGRRIEEKVDDIN